MLVKVFEDILKNKNEWLRSETGPQFEDKLELSLKNNNFTRMRNDSKEIEKVLKNIKNNIQYKLGHDYLDIKNFPNNIKNTFVKTPYGSQDFPDFLVFTESRIIPIETKYSKDKSCKPMWNSNLPKANAVYIFGAYKRKDVTFFLGNDVLPMKERELMIEFFDNAKKLTEEFQSKLKEEYSKNTLALNRGFNVYIRNAYDQNKNINTNANIDYFNHPNRKTVEQNVIDFCNNL